MVLATDGSELAADAGRRALALLPSGVEVVLVTVAGVEATDDTGAGGIEGPDITPQELERIRDEARLEGESVLTKTASALGVVGCRAKVLIGDPARAICDFARDVGADLIVVGSHGRGPVRRALLGSVSDAVVRHAPCPVLVVRSDSAGDRDR